MKTDVNNSNHNAMNQQNDNGINGKRAIQNNQLPNPPQEIILTEEQVSVKNKTNPNRIVVENIKNNAKGVRYAVIAQHEVRKTFYSELPEYIMQCIDTENINTQNDKIRRCTISNINKDITVEQLQNVIDQAHDNGFNIDKIQRLAKSSDDPNNYLMNPQTGELYTYNGGHEVIQYYTLSNKGDRTLDPTLWDNFQSGINGNNAVEESEREGVEMPF